MFNGAYPSLRVDAHAGPNRRIQLAERNDNNQFQNHFDYTSFDQILTSEGFPFTVDHDTNYVHYGGAQGGPGGEYGGIPQHWHIEYCKGEKFIKSAADLGYQSGWGAEYFFFTNNARANGFDNVIGGAKPAVTRSEDTLNWRNKNQWDGISQRDNLRAHYTAKWENDRPGDVSWRLCSDDGSRLYINDELAIDNWGLHGRRCRTTTRNMFGGWNDLRVQFFNAGGGANLKLGQHLVLPKDTPLCNVWLTMLNGMGVNVARHGDSSGVVNQLQA